MTHQKLIRVYPGNSEIAMDSVNDLNNHLSKGYYVIQVIKTKGFDDYETNDYLIESTELEINNN